MRPTLKFVICDKKVRRQTQNLERWWNRHQERVFRAMDFYINCRWEVDSIEVLVKPLSKKGSKAKTYECQGEIDIDEPNRIHISIGKRVRWSSRNLCVFIHELIHCATHSREDRRFNEPGLLEFWILDELATDLLAQYILRLVAGIRPKIKDSIEYALIDTSKLILKDKEIQDELVKRIKKELKSYVRTDKNFFSFRQNLKYV